MRNIHYCKYCVSFIVCIVNKVAKQLNNVNNEFTIFVI